MVAYVEQPIFGHEVEHLVHDFGLDFRGNVQCEEGDGGCVEIIGVVRTGQDGLAIPENIPGPLRVGELDKISVGRNKQLLVFSHQDFSDDLPEV